MRKFQYAFFCLVQFQILALAADSSLLSLVMPDAKVIAGAQVGQVKSSPFGLYVLAHLQLDDPDFQKFIAATGFDPLRDISEVVVASNASQNDPSHWLVLGKGTFDRARIQSVALISGGHIAVYKGVTIISGVEAGSAIAFLDGSTAVMGTREAVEAAIDRRQARAAVSTNLAGKVQQVSAHNDFWFTTLVPISEFANSMPNSNLRAAMKGNVLQAVQQASGGIKFGRNVQVFGEAVARSPQDASALVDVIKFIAGLIQTNRQSDKTAAQVSTLLDALQVSVRGNVMTMTLTIPEGTLEQMMDSMRQDRRSSPPAK